MKNEVEVWSWSIKLNFEVVKMVKTSEVDEFKVEEIWKEWKLKLMKSEIEEIWNWNLKLKTFEIEET